MKMFHYDRKEKGAEISRVRARVCTISSSSTGQTDADCDGDATESNQNTANENSLTECSLKAANQSSSCQPVKHQQWHEQ